MHALRFQPAVFLNVHMGQKLGKTDLFNVFLLSNSIMHSIGAKMTLE